MRRALTVLAMAAGSLAGVFAALRLGRRRPRDPARQAELDRAVAAVDREIAANLELTTMYDQTHQAFVLENGQFLAHRAVFERELPETFAILAALYERIPAAEAAMERRGPAGSIPDVDRRTVHEWEGDARDAQRALRSAAVAERSPIDDLIERIRRSVAR